MSNNQSEDDKIPYSVEHSIWLQQQALENHNTGDYLLAERLYEKSLNVFRTELGIDHLITVNCAISAAVNLKQIGKLIEAEDLIRESLKVMQAKLGMDHPDTLDCLLSLQDVLAVQDKKTEATDIAHTILDLTKKSYGPHHEKTIKAKNYLEKIASPNTSNDFQGHDSINKIADDKPELPKQQRLFNMEKHDDEIPVWKDPDYETSLAYAKGIARHIGRESVGLDVFLLGTWMAQTNEKLIENIALNHTQQPALLSISESITEEARLIGRQEGSISPYHGPELRVSKRLKQMLAEDRYASFIDLINRLFDEVSYFTQTSSGNNEGEALNNRKSREVDNPSEDTNDSFSIDIQQETKMWDKFNRVLNLGEEWANEEGKGEWQFSTGTKISVDFNSLDNLDDLEGVLDIFEEATDEDKDALRSSLEEEGQVSHFFFTVTPPSEQEYYFHQLTGGGGEPVVEDFYCDADQKNDISNALDEILEAGDTPISTDGSCNYSSGINIINPNQEEIKNSLRIGNKEFAIFSYLLDLNDEDITSAFHQQYELSLNNNKLLSDALGILGISEPYIYNTYSYGDRNAEKERTENGCRVVINHNNEALREAEAKIKQALIQPDVFSIWKITLLIKALNEIYENSSRATLEGENSPRMHKLDLGIRYDNPWVMSWQYFVTIDDCLNFLRSLNKAVNQDSNLNDLYADGLTTFSFCYLAAALDNEDIDDYIYNFTWFIRGERELYGLEAQDTGCGSGENLSFVRCSLEGLLDMPIEISDDMLSDDGEIIDLEDHDWNILADEIISIS